MDAFNSTFLTFLFVPNAPCAVDRARERVDYLIGSIHGSDERIVIPSPALSDLLIVVGHSRKQVLHELTHNPEFWIAPFEGDEQKQVSTCLSNLIHDTSSLIARLRTLADIAYVMKAGLLYEADTLTEIWPERRSYALTPWKWIAASGKHLEQFVNVALIVVDRGRNPNPVPGESNIHIRTLQPGCHLFRLLNQESDDRAGCPGGRDQLKSHGWQLLPDAG